MVDVQVLLIVLHVSLGSVVVQILVTLLIGNVNNIRLDALLMVMDALNRALVIIVLHSLFV